MDCKFPVVVVYYNIKKEKRWVFLSEQSSDRWISLKEACAYLGVQRQTIMKWINTKNMPASKVGKLWKFKVEDIDAWIKSGGASD